jgi:hypothetical protein
VDPFGYSACPTSNGWRTPRTKNRRGIPAMEWEVLSPWKTADITHHWVSNDVPKCRLYQLNLSVTFFSFWCKGGNVYRQIRIVVLPHLTGEPVLKKIVFPL